MVKEEKVREEGGKKWSDKGSICSGAKREERERKRGKEEEADSYSSFKVDNKSIFNDTGKENEKKRSGREVESFCALVWLGEYF